MAGRAKVERRDAEPSPSDRGPGAETPADTAAVSARRELKVTEADILYVAKWIYAEAFRQYGEPVNAEVLWRGASETQQQFCLQQALAAVRALLRLGPDHQGS